MGQHRVLSQAAQKLRTANQGARTNINFDDSTMQLALDYKVKDGLWSRLRPDQAKEVINTEEKGRGGDTSSQDFLKLLGPGTGANATNLGE